MEKISIFKSEKRTILFEAERQNGSGTFVIAKKYCNQRFLETGSFAEYMFDNNLVADASKEESEYYLMLKERSQFLIGKI